jgi:3-hydroxypropanoate dehydrogenase
VAMMHRIEQMRVSDDTLDLVFRKARTYNAWLPKPVPEELLRQLYDTLKWGPTSANNSPARFVFFVPRLQRSASVHRSRLGK